jgi:hypothetical protein
MTNVSRKQTTLAFKEYIECVGMTLFKQVEHVTKTDISFKLHNHKKHEIVIALPIAEFFKFMGGQPSEDRFISHITRDSVIITNRQIIVPLSTQTRKQGLLDEWGGWKLEHLKGQEKEYQVGIGSSIPGYKWDD